MTTVLMLLVLIVLAKPAGADAGMVDKSHTRPAVSWSRLVFQGSKLFNSISVKIQLSSGGQLSEKFSTEIGEDLVGCSGPVVDGSKVLTVQSSSGLISSKSRYEESIWFSEAAIRPEKKIRVSNDKSPWIKSYCWEDKGVQRQKISPGNPLENKQLPAKWTKRTTSFYEYPVDVAGCGAISDPALVFYRLSTLEPGWQEKPLQMCVFGRKQLHRLTIKLEKSSPLKVFYKTGPSTEEVTVEDQITPLVFSISTDTFAVDETDPETFSFLGLQKDIRIYMDPEKRLPVRISGTNNSVGNLILDLSAYSK